MTTNPISTAAGYWADDGNAAVYYPDAASGREAAEEYVADGDWGESNETMWIDVSTWREDEDGEALDEESFNVALDPEEPECSSEEGEHDWRAPRALVGGCRENPGVQAHGGGVVSTELCVRCGTSRTVDTWAQNPATGEQGLRSVSYEADDCSLDAHLEEWADDYEADRDDLVGGGDGWAVYLVEGPWGWRAVIVDRGDEPRSAEWFRGEDEAREGAQEWVDLLGDE